MGAKRILQLSSSGVGGTQQTAALCNNPDVGDGQEMVSSAPPGKDTSTALAKQQSHAARRTANWNRKGKQQVDDGSHIRHQQHCECSTCKEQYMMDLCRYVNRKLRRDYNIPDDENGHWITTDSECMSFSVVACSKLSMLSCCFYMWISSATKLNNPQQKELFPASLNHARVTVLNFSCAWLLQILYLKCESTIFFWHIGGETSFLAHAKPGAYCAELILVQQIDRASSTELFRSKWPPTDRSVRVHSATRKKYLGLEDAGKCKTWNRLQPHLHNEAFFQTQLYEWILLQRSLLCMQRGNAQDGIIIQWQSNAAATQHSISYNTCLETSFAKA